ncbi:YbaB/EbfC family nucleoid-associated protein [candidate division NPL-UPA2 bacterium Unc8]|uniref:Nucleoid-associated protein B9J77_04635 n=1 Tax=candidate division NPL-UPA2 bacterium Unc8 TaxID=1980939 RepID=A0A399FWC4_UNCN2|nr:MAG: YbaB/EbfC family nucleoid-associated protein [candidate division NPL-UPA2 bacterium Unc8]
MYDFNISKLFNYGKEIQKNMAKIKNELKTMTIESTAGGGMVTVIVNGEGHILSLKIDPTVVDPNDIEMIEDLVTSAVNDGLRRAHEAMTEKMEKITREMSIPKLGSLLGAGD